MKKLSTTTTTITKYKHLGLILTEENVDGKISYEFDATPLGYVGLLKNVPTRSSYRDLQDRAKFTFKKIPTSLDDMYFFFDNGGILFDSKKNAIPTVVKFDYVGTPFHNGCLDLVKARKILKKHPWVLDVSEIKKIEFYNSDENKNEYINVTICPDAETWNDLYMKHKKEEFWSCRMYEDIHDGYCPDEKHNFLGLLEAKK